MITFLAPGAHNRSFFVWRFFLRRKHLRQFWLVKFFIAVFRWAAAWRSRQVDPFVLRQACLISVVECNSAFCFHNPAFARCMNGDSTSIAAFSWGAASGFTVWLRFQITAIVWRVTLCPQMCVRLGGGLNDYLKTLFWCNLEYRPNRQRILGGLDLSWRDSSRFWKSSDIVSCR